MRAACEVAEQARMEPTQRMDKPRHPERPRQKSEAEPVRELRLALNGIASDSPARPKYEATLELMQRMRGKA